MKQHIQPPKDAKLPQLATVLDTHKMRDVFRNYWSANDAKSELQITGCDIERVKYKPGKNCQISYLLDFVDVNSGKAMQQRFFATVYPASQSQSRYQKALQQPLATPEIGEPVLYFPALEMVIRAFPNDRKLHGLPQVLQPETLREVIIPDALNSAIGANWQIENWQHEVVHFVPEHVCTLRVDVQLSGEHPRTESFFGKVYYNDEGAKTIENMQRIWQSPLRKNGTLNMAKPLAYYPKWRSMWQQGLPGGTLLDHGFGSDAFMKMLPKAAGQVAALHRCALPNLPETTRESIAEKLISVQQLLEKTGFDNLKKSAALVNLLLNQRPFLSESPAVTLHGDLHLKNFLTNEKTVSLIDLDSLASGDPAVDLGSFIAGMLNMGIQKRLSATQLRKVIGVFIDAYQRASSLQIDPAKLRWHIAAALIIERVFRAITRQKSTLNNLPEYLVILAHDIACAADAPGIFKSLSSHPGFSSQFGGRNIF